MMENNQMNEKWSMICVENVILNAFDIQLNGKQFHDCGAKWNKNHVMPSDASMRRHLCVPQIIISHEKTIACVSWA